MAVFDWFLEFYNRVSSFKMLDGMSFRQSATLCRMKLLKQGQDILICPPHLGFRVSSDLIVNDCGGANPRRYWALPFLQQYSSCVKGATRTHAECSVLAPSAANRFRESILTVPEQIRLA
jgi:hypothetical protein